MLKKPRGISLYESNKPKLLAPKDKMSKRGLPSIGAVDHIAAKEKLAKLIDATDPKNFGNTNSTFASSLKGAKKD